MIRHGHNAGLEGAATVRRPQGRETVTTSYQTDRISAFLESLPCFERERVEKRIAAGYRIVSFTVEDGITMVKWASPVRVTSYGPPQDQTLTL